jgi:hypothetical protein
MASGAAVVDRTGLAQMAPGVWVDPNRVKVDSERKWLLLDASGYMALGLSRDKQKSIYRLFECGRIKLHRITPRLTLLDLESWEAHLQMVHDDPWYWENRRNLEAYRGTYE